MEPSQSLSSPFAANLLQAGANELRRVVAVRPAAGRRDDAVLVRVPVLGRAVAVVVEPVAADLGGARVHERVAVVAVVAAAVRRAVAVVVPVHLVGLPVAVVVDPVAAGLEPFEAGRVVEVVAGEPADRATATLGGAGAQAVLQVAERRRQLLGLVGDTVAVVVDPVAALRDRCGSVADEIGALRRAVEEARATPGLAVDGAGLAPPRHVVDETVAVVVRAVAALCRRDSRGAVGPALVRRAGLLAPAGACLTRVPAGSHEVHFFGPGPAVAAFVSGKHWREASPPEGLSASAQV